MNVGGALSKSILKSDCALRSIQKKDEALMLGMRNQECVRRQMISSNVISKGQHKKWFSEMLSDPSKQYFVFYYKSDPVGIIGFFDVNEQFANWSFYLGDHNLPKGLGTIMCSLGLEYIFENISVRYIETQIKIENLPSQKIHLKLGFIRSSDKSNNNFIFRLMRENWSQNSIKK